MAKRGTGLAVGVGLLALCVGMTAAATPAQAMAQDTDSTQASSLASQTREQRRAAREEQRAERRRRAEQRERQSDAVRDPDEIVVVGLRKSVRESIDRKRNAKQIVDVVTAEDAGKLPDNNVVEAMARITGINVTRSQGRADGFTIRGLNGVQTTVNGNEIGSAGSRTLGLATVPAELVKSIEVYKTRTADQIEGGIGGSVNIELRRPLDLGKGWTVAGSARGQYQEQGSSWSPFFSALVANRFDTGIGEVGFLVNGSYNNPKYDEAYNYTESPFFIGCPTCTIRQSLPADQRDTLVAPFRAAYGTNSGERKQKSLSGAIQWQPSSDLNFVLEGSYFGEEFRDQFNSLYVNTREDYYTLQNLRIGEGGVLLGYDILNLPDADGEVVNFGRVNAGFNGGQNEGKTETYRANFETHWAIPGLKIDASAQYQWGNANNYRNGHNGNYTSIPRVRVDFDSPKVLGNGPYFDFGNVNPTDPAQARIQALFDNIGFSEYSQFSAQVDLTKDLSGDTFFRSFQMGARYAINTNSYGSSYRHAGWFDPELQPALSSIASAGVDTIQITPDLPGGSPLSWIQLNSGQVYDRWVDVEKFIIANNPEELAGPGRERGAAAHFASLRPSSEDTVFSGRVKENVFSAYGMMNYAFKAIFPIDGNVGVRYVNTFASNSGNNLQLGPPIRDAAGNPIPGQFGPDVVENIALSANYVDILPSAFSVIHFTPKLQLRGSYSFNVQRPGLQQLRNFRQIDYRNPGSPIYAGNPELEPTTTDDYNLSLEWYFGSGGLISLTGFAKDQTGFIYYTRQLEPIPELGGEVREVFQDRNAGPGRTRGLEFQATSFFTFLPGLLRNFGATVNATWIPTAEVSLPVPAEQTPGAPIVYDFVARRSPFVSRFSYNLIGYYETPTFGVRVAYNRRSSYQTGIDAVNETYIKSSQPTQRLDAAITYTPFKFVTLSVEGQNLLRNIDRQFYYLYPDLPDGLRAMGRTIVAGARFRF